MSRLALALALTGVLADVSVIAAGGNVPLVAVEWESRDNTLDGCAACGCQTVGHLQEGQAKQWWVVMGLVVPDGEHGWKVLDSASRCGAGPFSPLAVDFNRTVGVPYRITEATVRPLSVSTNRCSLELMFSTSTLTGFDEENQPVYEASSETRRLQVVDEATMTIPIFVPTGATRAAFAIHEVLLTLRATVLLPGPTNGYGALTIMADVPAADILIDGGPVARVLDGAAAVVKPVPAGKRTVRVQDLSGRYKERELLVKADEMTEVAFQLLDLSSVESDQAVVPLGKNHQGYEEYWRVKDRAVVIEVPAGKFVRGSAEGQGHKDEHPQREIHVSTFLIDKTEVTWRQFREFASATDTKLPPPSTWGMPDDYAVASVRWEDAQQYCEWVGGRLPTEAEWEKAARGTTGFIYPWGNQWDPERCNSIAGGPHHPAGVGAFPDCVSPYGALDMAGGLWEWCADWYGENYYAESPARDPRGPDSGTLRIVRGGAWMSQPDWLRTAYRFKSVPTSPHADRGFRCVQPLHE